MSARFCKFQIADGSSIAVDPGSVRCVRSAPLRQGDGSRIEFDDDHHVIVLGTLEQTIRELMRSAEELNAVWT